MSHVLRKYVLLSTLSFLGLFRYYKKYGAKLQLNKKVKPDEIIKLYVEAKSSTEFYKVNLPNIEPEAFMNSFQDLNLEVSKKQIRSHPEDFVNKTRISRAHVFSPSSSIFQSIRKSYSQSLIIKMSTAGSTGEPLNFYMNKSRALKYLFGFIAVAKFIGWTVGERFMPCVQGGMYQHSNVISRILPFLGATGFLYKTLNLESAKEFVHDYNKVKPRIIFSTPSFLSEILQYVEQNDLEIDNKFLKGVMVSGEMLSESQRSFIEKQLGRPVYNIYACNEIGIMGVECYQHDGFHILEDRVFLESNNKNEIVATALESYCQPFIKYKLHDVGEIVHERCSCGVHGNKIRNLQGRVEDYIIMENGHKIHASFLRQLIVDLNLRYGNSILNGRFIQKKDLKIDFILQLLSTDHAESILAEVINYIKSDFQLEAQGKIKMHLLSDGGKLKFFTSQV